MTRLEKCELALSKGILYNPITGFITGVKGNVLKSKCNQGYICFGIWYNNKTYKLYGHQFAWYFMYNECIPIIDHKNRIKTDNRKLNLRKSTRQLNRLNSNSKGYSFDSSTGKFLCQIMVKGKNINLGRFNKKEDASEAYNKYKEQLINKL